MWCILALAISFPAEAPPEYVDRIVMVEHVKHVPTPTPEMSTTRERHVYFQRRDFFGQWQTDKKWVKEFPTPTISGYHRLIYLEGKRYRTRDVRWLRRTTRAAGMEGIR